MKSLPAILLVMSFCLLLVVGCSPQTKDLNSDSPAKQKYQEPDRPSLDKSKDYSKDISGGWKWYVMQGKNVMSSGEFWLQEKDGKIIGFNRAISSISAVPGKGGNPDIRYMVSHTDIKGFRDANSPQTIKFVASRDGKILVKNVASLFNKGRNLKGESIEKEVINKKTIAIRYSWQAERISG